MSSPTVTCSNLSSGAISYNWNFGDGATSTATNPPHTYASTGTYTISLEAISGSCAHDTMSLDIVVINATVIAQFSTNNTAVCEGDTVVFTSTSQNATSLIWDTPGATLINQSGTHCTVVYSGAGTFDVELIAISVYGNDTLEFTNYMNVLPNAIAQFNVSNDTVPIANPLIVFTNQSQQADAYLWHFGDGVTSTDINPYHTYATAPASYNVLLEAISNTCSDDSSSILIVVIDPVGISEGQKHIIHIYPNPVNDIIFIEAELSTNAKYCIHDAAGKLILSGNLIEKTSAVNISNLAEGLYSLVISDNNHTTTFRFVKK